MFQNIPQFLSNIGLNVYFNMFCLVIIGSIIPYILMGIGQSILDAQKAALIYLLEPVFAMIIALIFF